MTKFGDTRLPDRFWVRVDISDDGCWNWTGSRTTQGYGRISWDGRLVPAHRLAYEVLVETIDPPELKSDHLCRNTSCVNPEHIEPVTNAENTRRGLSGNKDTCRQGLHPWPPESPVYRNGRPCCRECVRANKRAYKAMRREAARKAAA